MEQKTKTKTKTPKVAWSDGASDMINSRDGIYNFFDELER